MNRPQFHTGPLVVAPVRGPVAALLAGALLVTLGALGTLAVQRAWPAVRPVDFKMEAACNFPKHEGEMTVVTVLNKKLICWRWK